MASRTLLFLILLRNSEGTEYVWFSVSVKSLNIQEREEEETFVTGAGKWSSWDS